MKRNSLLCVKSIITIIIVLAAAVLTFIFPEQMMDTFKSAVTMIITFYFAHQTDKLNQKGDTTSNGTKSDNGSTRTS